MGGHTPVAPTRCFTHASYFSALESSLVLVSRDGLLAGLSLFSSADSLKLLEVGFLAPSSFTLLYLLLKSSLSSNCHIDD